MSKKNTKYQITILTISIIFWIYLLGINYISPLNIEWLSSGDLSTYQLGWQYFREDIWRFPLGINPNYGIYSDSNIIYSDSVPLFAITFKPVANVLLLSINIPPFLLIFVCIL